LRRVPVKMIAARNANVGHPLPPQFGCHDIKGRCTMQRQCHR
jgi:hypothetical protein